MRKKEIEKRLAEHYQELLTIIPEKQVFALCLQGSQNYNMADKDSDIDSKAIVLPSLDDIIFNHEAKSYTHVRANDEHIDIKDIRLMFNQYRKQNINFVETLFTKYVIVNPIYQQYWDLLISRKEEIAHYNPLQAMKTMCGMCSEKFHALLHEYPSRKYWLDKFGYDPKQLSHLIRVYEFMKMYSKGVPYEDCLIPFSVDYLHKVKRGQISYTPEVAEQIAQEYLDRAVSLKKEYESFAPAESLKPNQETDKFLDDVLNKIMRTYMKEELNNADS